MSKWFNLLFELYILAIILTMTRIIGLMSLRLKKRNPEFQGIMI